MEQIPRVTHDIFRASLENSFRGYDPFDGLNSRFFNVVPFLKRGIFGLAWIQFHKRSIVNLRRLLLVPEKRNPKGVALFILGMLEQYKHSSDPQLLKECEYLADWLLSQVSDPGEWGHACWGYHFDWNARAFFVPRGKPNVITTIYVAQALYRIGTELKRQEYIDASFDAANFIVKTLYVEEGGRRFFAYIPGEAAFVHNASLWGSAWVAFVANETGNEKYSALALSVARQSISEQASDGSWVYGSRHHHQFIDGFHTGYNLEALDMLRTSLGTSEFDGAIAKGYEYYKDQLFEKNGLAKYYSNNPYPLDMHSVSQAIITFIKVGGGASDYSMAEKVINWSISELYMSDKKRFVYQKTKHFVNKTNYTRWTQAWVYYSFSYYCRKLAEQNEKD
ncbi:hypothetical protein [uncultured Pseudoteredinibacter sp.]|uniref:hypothetical protein n=1 Tax=uncultured Pseudoteredinibacter sp. TaxID=1641701 RepID=UPI0026074C17|nr:hypothetical protein [uncultured Pseudoteredinibacter sp.]